MQFPLRIRWLLGASLALAACDNPLGQAAPSRIVQLEVEASDHPLIRTAIVTLDQPAAVTLTWSSDGISPIVLAADHAAARHVIVLPRLRAGRLYTLEAVVPLGPDARRTVGFTTGELPPDIAAIGNSIPFIANETRTVRDTVVIGEAVWEWLPETGAVERRWSAFDHLDWATDRTPRADPFNWLHGNGLAWGARGNVLMSLRNIDQVISIAPDFTRVEWRLGGPGATLAVADADRFLGQHGISETGPGRLLVFDNGWERPGTRFSRAIEYDIDTTAGRLPRSGSSGRIRTSMRPWSAPHGACPTVTPLRCSGCSRDPTARPVRSRPSRSTARAPSAGGSPSRRV